MRTLLFLLTTSAVLNAQSNPKPVDPGDAPVRELLRSDTPEAKFLRDHPTASKLTYRKGQLRFRNANGTKTAILGAVTRQDPASGAWVSNAPVLSQTTNGWRLDGARNDVTIRKGTNQHIITQAFTAFDTKHESTLVLTVPTLAYDSGLQFRFSKDSLTWNVRFDTTGALDLTASVAAKRGPKTYTFDVSSSETLTVNKDGHLVGDGNVNVTRAVMIPRKGARVFCSAWTYSKQAGASFICDDSAFKPDQLPYLIDPSSHNLTDPGTYHLEAWSDGTDSGGTGGLATFNTNGFLPAGATYINESCGYNVLSQDGGNIQCGATPFNNSGNTYVELGIGAEQAPYAVSADINNVTLTVVWDQQPVYSFNVRDSNNQPYTGPLYVGSDYYVNGSIVDPDGDVTYGPRVSISAGAVGTNPQCTWSGGGQFIWFADDNGVSSWMAGPASNSQCTVQAVGTVSFTQSFIGTKNVYVQQVLNSNIQMSSFYNVGQLTIAPGTVVPPVASPVSGTYTSALTVSFGGFTSGASVRYTLDGTTPTSTYGTLYGGSFQLGTNGVVTLKAMAYKSGWNDSSVTTTTYTINIPPITTPAAGTYPSAQSVTISTTTAGGTIRYTTNGTAPTTTSAIYTGPLLVSNTMTIKAIVYKSGFPDSGVTTATYTIGSTSATQRRVGVRPTGAYWGAAGEQIDLLSGNLNYSIPLIQAKGRGTSAVSLGLSYNSQIWQQYGSASSLLGRDIGYGLGWIMQVGSLSPIGNMYLFTDASGAQYKLDQYAGGVWTSREGVYVSYNESQNRLYFNDGSSWAMGCTSSAGEPDAATIYPTGIADTNGNVVSLEYGIGAGASQVNTSGRITKIVDARMIPSIGISYAFTYDGTNHLTGITSNLQTPENYTLSYGTVSLQSPFNAASFGTAKVLQAVTIGGLNISHAFQYASNSGELVLATTPFGGALGWQYRSWTYSGSSVTSREVQTRTMRALASLPQYSWSIAHDDVNTNLHVWTRVTDTGATTSKTWTFQDTGTYLGLAVQFAECNGTSTCGGAGSALVHNAYTWTQDANSQVYIGAVLTTLYPNSQTKTEQTLDIYGNITQTKVYDYGSLSTPMRTSNFTYLTDSNYTSRYIRNRLVSSPTVSQIVYDNYAAPNPLQLRSNAVQHDDGNYGTSFIYRGNPTSVISLAGTVSYAYETTGVVYKKTDGNGVATTSSFGLSTAYSLPSVLTPNGNSNLATSISYTNAFAVSSVSGPNGATGATNYDSYGRPMSVVSVDGATTAYTYTYNPNTQKATITATAPATGTRWKKTTLDGFGRSIQVETGHDSTTEAKVDTEYGPCGCSPLGKVKRVSQPYQGSPTAWTEYTYDGAGRTLTVKAPDNASTTQYTYIGNKTTVTDPAGKWKMFTRDGAGNLTAVNEPNPGGGADFVTNYTYTNLDQLTGVSMPRGGYTQTRTFTYSGSDMISATNPENGTVTYEYDNMHRVTKRTDAKGQQTRYTYDPYGRLTQVQHWTSQEQVAQRVDYYYDSNPFDGQFSQYAWGRLAAVVFHGKNADFAYMYSYNPAGRITKQRLRLPYPATQTSPQNDLDATYTWDNEGRMTSVQYPTGSIFNYQFDAMGRLSSGGGVTSAAYNIAGQITALAYDGYQETRTYNSLQQLTQIRATYYSRQTPDMDMTYVYSSTQNNGRITQSSDAVTGEQVSYQYDSLNRLVRAETADTAWGQTFAYDGFGNMTAKAAIKGSPAPPSFTATFDPATNRQTGMGLQYDANGNPTNGISDAYDVENRFVGGVTTPESYGYDPSGKRIWMIKPHSTTIQGSPATTCEIYFYGITGQKLVTYQCGWNDADGGNGEFWYGAAGENTYFGGKLIRSKGVTVVTDRLGSVRGNANGERMSYYPYGEERTSTSDNREKFGTYTRDPGGIDYADQRYYSAGLGRFLAPDPSTGVDFMNPGSWNKYAYVSGDPVNRYDPSGMLEADPNDPGDPTVSLGMGFLTGYGKEGPYTYGGTTISVTGVNTQVGGGSGTGSNDYRPKGLLNGYQALTDLSKGANLESATCQRILNQLYALNGSTGISDVVAKIKQMAYTIQQQGLLFDGASSNTPFTVANFGQPRKTDNPSADGTVGGYFKANPDVVGLSQNTGYAIWIRSTYAENVLQAQDTVLHEVLHKIAAPFSVDRINDGDLGQYCFRNH